MPCSRVFTGSGPLLGAPWRTIPGAAGLQTRSVGQGDNKEKQETSPASLAVQLIT